MTTLECKQKTQLEIIMKCHQHDNNERLKAHQTELSLYIYHYYFDWANALELLNLGKVAFTSDERNLILKHS